MIYLRPIKPKWQTMRLHWFFNFISQVSFCINSYEWFCKLEFSGAVGILTQMHEVRAVVKTSRTSYLKLIRREAIKLGSTWRHWTSVFTEAIRGDPSGNSRTINKAWWAKARMFIVKQAALMLNLSCSDHGSRSGFLTSFVSLITLTRRQEPGHYWDSPFRLVQILIPM